MKYLKIEDNRGYFLKGDGDNATWVEIDKINKDDLLNILNKAISGDFEMDVYLESSLGNKAHQIIYKNVYEKLANLESMRDKFNDESENMYRDAIEKYGSN